MIDLDVKQKIDDLLHDLCELRDRHYGSAWAEGTGNVDLYYWTGKGDAVYEVIELIAARFVKKDM